MKFRGWIERQPLRVKLIGILISLLVVVCATVGIATAVALRGFLIKRLDQQLAAAGNRYATALEHGDNDTDNPETVTRGRRGSARSSTTRLAHPGTSVSVTRSSQPPGIGSTKHAWRTSRRLPRSVRGRCIDTSRTRKNYSLPCSNVPPPTWKPAWSR